MKIKGFRTFVFTFVLSKQNDIRYFLNILLCLLPIFCRAQSFGITVQTTPNFEFSNSTELEAGEGVSPYTLITNCFYLTVDNDNDKSCQVYAAIPGGITLSNGANTSMSTSNIQLKLRSHTAGGNATSVLTGEVPMTTGNPGTRLFSQKRNKNSYRYYYDVLLPTIGYSYSPGRYSYTLKFTMTMP